MIQINLPFAGRAISGDILTLRLYETGL